MKPKRTLLTGASGFLGRYITESLILKNINYDSLGRTPPTPIVGNFIRCDLASDSPVSLKFAYSHVIHAAGLAHIIQSKARNTDIHHQVTVTGTQNLIRALDPQKMLIKHFVFISSVAVYGRDTGTYIDENQPLQGVDPYGASKIKAESLISKWCGKNNIPLLILRLPLVLGRNPKGNLQSLIESAQKKIRFRISPNYAHKSVVHASDVADLVTSITQAQGIFNLTDGFEPLFDDIAGVIFNYYDTAKEIVLPVSLSRAAATIGDLCNSAGIQFPLTTHIFNKITKDLTFDSSKARHELGWNPHNALVLWADSELSVSKQTFNQDHTCIEQ